MGFPVTLMIYYNSYTAISTLAITRRESAIFVLTPQFQVKVHFSKVWRKKKKLRKLFFTFHLTNKLCSIMTEFKDVGGI